MINFLCCFGWHAVCRCMLSHEMSEVLKKLDKSGVENGEDEK